MSNQQHELYMTGDSDAPDNIKDRNGWVALRMCRKCGKAEIDLDEPCEPCEPSDQQESEK